MYNKNEFIGVLVNTITKTIDAEVSINYVPETLDELDIVVEKNNMLFIAVRNTDCTLWLENHEGDLLPKKDYKLHQKAVDQLILRIKKQLH